MNTTPRQSKQQHLAPRRGVYVNHRVVLHVLHSKPLRYIAHRDNLFVQRMHKSQFDREEETGEPFPCLLMPSFFFGRGHRVSGKFFLSFNNPRSVLRGFNFGCRRPILFFCILLGSFLCLEVSREKPAYNFHPNHSFTSCSLPQHFLTVRN